jgi:hypothetical protein
LRGFAKKFLTAIRSSATRLPRSTLTLTLPLPGRGDKASRISAILILLCFASCASAQTVTLTYRGLINTGQAFNDGRHTFAINGLSGITRRHDAEFLAIMDNSRLIVRMTIAIDKDGSLLAAKYIGIIPLAQRHDFEGIALPGDDADDVFLSEEDTPAIRQFHLKDGASRGQVHLPAVYLKGNARGNFGLESLTIRDGQMWTANEEALRSDGERSTAQAGTLVRLTRFALQAGEWVAKEQFAYLTDPIPAEPNDKDRSKSRSGVSDLMLMPDGRLLVLERAFALTGPANLLSKFRNRIYLVGYSSATNVCEIDSLKDRSIEPAKKTLLWSHEGNDIGNLEGLALGPKLGENRWAVVGVVDNNANALMPNRVVSFELKLSATPTTPSTR